MTYRPGRGHRPNNIFQMYDTWARGHGHNNIFQMYDTRARGTGTIIFCKCMTRGCRGTRARIFFKCMTCGPGGAGKRIYVECVTYRPGRGHKPKNIFQMYDRRAMLFKHRMCHGRGRGTDRNNNICHVYDSRGPGHRHTNIFQM